LKRADWLERLWSEIDAASVRDFEWGAQDCCLFAARCVDAMVDGSEYVAELQAAYHDKTSALRFLVGQGGLAEAVTTRFGSPISWPQAMRGDLCLIPTADGVGSLGVCVGPTVVCVHEAHGIAYMPTDQALACWGVR
jgi:hypothetical protein